MPIGANSLSSALGLPTKQDLLLQKGQADTVPAVINDAKTQQPKAPAQLSEGEYVFSVPAIIALGDGDYDTGLQLLDQIHQELRAKAEQMIGDKGLGAIPQ